MLIIFSSRRSSASKASIIFEPTSLEWKDFLLEELDTLIAAVRQKETQVRIRSIQRYEATLRILRANPTAKAKEELGEALASLRKLLEH